MLMLLRPFKFQDQLSELLIALEEKSMKIEQFVSDIESLFNSVEVSPVFYHTSFLSHYKITSKRCLPCFVASLLPLKKAVSPVLKLTSPTGRC